MNITENTRKIIRGFSFAGIIAAVGYFLFQFYLIFLGRVSISNAATIGIIGGADGPTAIFITSSPSINWRIVAIVLLLISLFGVYLTRKKKV